MIRKRECHACNIQRLSLKCGLTPNCTTDFLQTNNESHQLDRYMLFINHFQQLLFCHRLCWGHCNNLATIDHSDFLCTNLLRQLLPV